MTKHVCSSSTRSVSPVSEKTGQSVHRIQEQYQFARQPSQQRSEKSTRSPSTADEMLESHQDFLGSGFASSEGNWQPFDEPTLKTNPTSMHVLPQKSSHDGISRAKTSSMAMWGRKRRTKPRTEGSETSGSEISSQPCSSDASTVIWGVDERLDATLIHMGDTHPNKNQSVVGRGTRLEDIEVSMMVQAELESLRNERAELNHLRIANRELLVANDYLLQEHGRIVQELRCQLKVAQGELDKWNLAYTSLPHRFVRNRCEGDAD